MIISIWTHIKDIVDVLDTIVSITTLLPWGIRFEKPQEKDQTYMYISLVSDLTNTQSNKGSIIKTARLSFHIVGWNQDIIPNDLYNIVDTITNEIVDEWCIKIALNNLKLIAIDEWTISPVFTIEKNKPYIIKDYFFTYYSK